MNQEYVRKEFEKISSSKVFVSVVTEDYIKDGGRCALELGLAMLLDKPIRLLVREGTVVPRNIQRIAEKIEYYKAEDDVGIAGERLIADLL